MANTLARPPARSKVANPCYAIVRMAATIREQLREALRGRPKTAFELSHELHQSEKEIVEHLVHLQRSLPRQGLALHVVPARCKACDKTFDDRDRLTRPSRCPKCKSERIEAPAFALART